MRYVLVVILIISILSPMVIATPPIEPLLGPTAECCMRHNKGDPILFRIVRDNMMGGGFGVGDAENFRDAPQINISTYFECCNHVTDKNGCYNCMEREIGAMALRREPKETRTILFGSLIAGFVIGGLVVWLLLRRRKRLGTRLTKA